VTGQARHPLLPNVPTFEELGYKGFDGVQWYGIVGPSRLPPAIVAKLHAEIDKALASPALRQRLEGEAITPMPMTPEEFGRFIQSEIAHWGTVARDRKISLEE
jgi:tripartite-type tricarboxylate transporter receptor subunit TctC